MKQLKKYSLPLAGLSALIAALIALECAALLPSLRERFAPLAAVSASQAYHGALLALILPAAVGILLHLFKKRGKPCPARPYLVILSAVLLAECCVFNFRFFESLTFPAEEPLVAAYGDGLVLREDGYAYRDDRETYQVYAHDAARGATVTLTPASGAPMTLDSLYLGVSGADEPYVTVQITCFDAGNARGVTYPAVAVYDATARSQYLRLHPAGKVTKLVVAVSEVKFLWVTGFSANPRIPLRVSPLRVALLFLVLSLAYVVRPGSPLYGRVLDLDSPVQRRIVRTVCAVLVLLLLVPTLFCHNPYVQNQEYQRFAEAFLDGRLSLNEAPSEALLSLDNPYDLTLRIEMQELLDDDFYLWDYALYNGRYYMYFGVVPALLAFLPFQLVTGRALPTIAAVDFSFLFFAAGMFALLGRIARRFRAPRLLTYLLVACSAVLSSGIVFSKIPTVYHVPVSMGLALAVWGLYLWDTAVKPDGRLCLWRTAAGSLLIALVFGCRPQIGLVFLLGVPFLVCPLLQKTIPAKERARAAFFAALPFLLVAAGLMWYNAARFGSPFDFGANYNLTSNDMRQRGWNLDRLPLGLLYQLFSLPVLSGTFPFLQPLDVQTAYQGVTVSEPFFGGVFATSPLLLVIGFLFVYKKRLAEKRLLGTSLLLLLLPLAVLCLDVEMAGLLHRYKLDFLFLLFLLAAIVCFSIEEAESGRLLRLFRTGLFLCVLFGACYAFCYLFAYEPVEAIWRDEFPSLVTDLCTGWMR